MKYFLQKIRSRIRSNFDAAFLFEASLVSKYDNNKIAFVGIEAWLRSAGVPTKLALVAVGELSTKAGLHTNSGLKQGPAAK